jgi:carboxyl-terminal processing protease
MIHRLLAAAMTAAILISAPVQAADKKKNDDDTYRLLNLFGDVLERIRADYVEEPDDEKLIQAAITGMLTSLDPHSSFLDLKNFREMQVQTRGEFGGLGIQVTMEGGLVKVISPIDDTPAFRAGIEPSDLITHLDGEPVLGLTLNQAVDKMRGKVGSDLRMIIRRQGRDDFPVTITRAVIKVQSVKSSLKDKVGYLRITSFNEQTEPGVKKAMKRFHKELGDGLQGVILDLRRNPGGLLDQAIAVSDAFLERGEIVSTRSKKPEETQRYNARPGDLAKGLPLIVLINGGSASASEIVAGALQDHKRALILGTKSFGKGSVQTVIPLPGKVAMRLTTARYFTPSGRSIQAVGIEPDIPVEQAKVETVTRGRLRREADLRGALENGNATKKNDEKKDEKTDEKPGKKDDKKGTEKADKKAKPAPPPQDYQLERALDLLRGLALFGNQLTKVTP